MERELREHVMFEYPAKMPKVSICAAMFLVACSWSAHPAGAADPNNEPWRLMPVNKIYSDEPVWSAMNFGQMKPGAKLPKLVLRYCLGGRGGSWAA